MADAIAGVASPTARAASRSPGQLAWRRFRRDRVAVTSGVVVGFLVVVSLCAPIICSILGINTERNVGLLSIDNVGFPEGRMGGISTEHPLGLEPKSGRDLLALLLYGSRTSLVIAFGATFTMIVLGTLVGLCAGYFGGWVDIVLSRLMEILMAFPVLMFSIALLSVLGNVNQVLFLEGNGLRMAVLVSVIGFFSFPYAARLIRGQVISLREREFVGAARAMGSSSRRILRKELLPNLFAPIIVVSSIVLPGTILAEAGLSFLGVGITPPATSWGQLLGSASRVFVVDPWYMLFPGLTMVITVLAFNLLGDGVRDAFDPRSTTADPRSRRRTDTPKGTE